jgi:hypothetical protein
MKGDASERDMDGSGSGWRTGAGLYPVLQGAFR